MKIPFYDERPAYEAKGFNPHRRSAEPQENESNNDVKIITGVSPMYHFADQVFFTFLFFSKDKIVKVNKKNLGNGKQYEVMRKVYNEKFFQRISPI